MLIGAFLIVEAAMGDSKAAALITRFELNAEHSLRAVRTRFPSEPGQLDLAVGFECQETAIVRMAFAVVLGHEKGGSKIAAPNTDFPPFPGISGGGHDHYSAEVKCAS